MHDVVVVGGGPAGCYAASLLGKRGLKVHVLEEHVRIGEPVDCSGVMGAESFDLLQLPDSLKLGEIRALNFVSPSRLEVHFSPPSPLAYILDRAAFDRAIADKTAASGATFHLGTRVVDVHVLDECVDVVCQSSVGSQQAKSNVQGPKSDVQSSKFNVLQEEEGTNNDLRITNNEARSSVRARMVILANGPRYKLQRKLGMGVPTDFLRTAQTETRIRGLTQTKVVLGSDVAPGSFAWIVPFRRGGVEWARIGVSTKTNAVPYLQRLLSGLERAGHLDRTDASFRSWVIPIRPLKRTYSERILAVGDAAGQTKPTTGGGIFYGLLCAEAAAETAVEAFDKKDFGLSVMRGYETRWRKRVGREIKTGILFRRLGEKLTDGEIDELFRIVQSDGILAAVSKTARFDWHRDVISFVLRHPSLGKVFLKSLFH